MRRRQIIRHPRLWPRGKRQSEIEGSLPHQPNSGGPITMTKENKSMKVTSRNLCRERQNLVPHQTFHESLLGQRGFAENADGLLPFTLARDVAVIAAAKSKDRKAMVLVVVVVSNPTPGLIVSSGQLIQRRGAKLRMLRQKADNLHGVGIADQTDTSSPGITITVRLDQVPP